MDANKTHKEKARWELHKNATICMEHILTKQQWYSHYLSSHKPSK